MADSTVSSGVSFEITAIKTLIAQALVDRVRTIGQLKYIEFEDIKIAVSDFQDHQLPAVQFWDVIETGVHQQGRIQKTWNVILELIMKSSEERVVQQKNLWNLVYLIERAIWAKPQLGVKGVEMVQYISNETDLHLVQPYYTARISLNVIYHQPLVSEC